MKKIAVTACYTSVRAVFAAFFLALAGCALPLPDKPTRPAPWDLGPLPAQPAAAPSAAPAPALALDTLDAPATLDSTAIVYRLLYAGSGQQPRPYAQARWTMSPPQLVTQRLRESLAATRPVIGVGSGLAPLELHGELEEFAHVFSAPDASEGVVRLRLTATAPGAKDHRLLGQRSFTARQPAPSPDVAGGAQALREATDAVLRQVVQWVDALPTAR